MPAAPTPRTVAYFHDLLTRHPAHPDALFGYAGALDFAGVWASS